MSLKDRITEDMKSAMRAKETDKLGTIRMLLAAVKQKEVDERVVVNDTDLVAIVDKLIKQRKDAQSQFAAAGRQDLADKEAAEIDVLKVYLPERLDAAGVAAEIAALVLELGGGQKLVAADMGKVMGAAKAKLAGKADMAMVSAAVKQALS
ncbi:MAG: GatB/YqeY domain-containing protein [Burkholderiales bacterium]|uniref:GatB/YqeY domain-containing protein n=1 Tax=Inhella sp. TaxID=1921806 RepID=UPI001ACAD82D|nr:GatB/YqeY domain-containing protein [Burkholderiales bacterium]